MLNTLYYSEKDSIPAFNVLHYTLEDVDGVSAKGGGNGNVSKIHWDMVYRMQPEYGGGEIWFDDMLIQKDGLYVPEELQALNPALLKKEIAL